MTASYYIQRGLLLSALIMVISCSQADTAASPAQKKGTVKVSYVDNIEKGGDALIMIEGMSCERMCVNAVSKSIAAVPSVTIQEMRFDTAQSIDTLIVNYDATQTNERALIEAIESLAGGDTYRVKEVQLSKDAKTSEHFKYENGWKGPNVDRYRFEVPNFFDVLRKVSL